ncbi:NUMOD1 domain-containing DNA-binding protein [Salegentibacter salarius]|uniref:Nuclease-associated modular DNA-binding 1 domain-containing protein n=1 Tax=Salegentibacter salarius TaxID=435906 RepID=A0A2N0TRE1_9FLAO|nr:NUMOD1 domain-containing DNA-binding protein [Salegentibacter salarius]OEY71958.1 hypothetical protein BHS39_14670 [Salegentibacter salarius]PKD17314.1 hypothetical protein APR40_14640 [Salegentibacter salarius]SLK05551.1 NUMOD1 domain-containing protein [Salegentibacter salarius]
MEHNDRIQNLNRRIYQYNAKTGRLVTSYWSLEEAAKHLDADPNTIEKACRGDLKTSNGFCWSYALAINFKHHTDKRKKQVFLFNKDGEFLASFKSVAEASKKTKINKTSIAKCCRGEYKSAGNYYWEYESKYKVNDEGNSL